MGGTMRWAELRMCRFWAGGISSFPFSRAREYRLLRRLVLIMPRQCPLHVHGSAQSGSESISYPEPSLSGSGHTGLKNDPDWSIHKLLDPYPLWRSRARPI